MIAQSINTQSIDTIVIGAGIAGLATAAYLAKAGQRVTLLEKSQHIGGKAITRKDKGFSFNLGAHALYRGGPALSVLEELGVTIKGTIPGEGGGYGWVAAKSELSELPLTPKSIISTALLDAEGKRGYMGFFAKLFLINPDSLSHLTVQQWIDSTFRHAGLRQLMHATFRLGTYTNAPDQFSAAAAMRQLQRAIAKNVLYLDGGWQTIVDGLRDAAQQAGVLIRTATAVTAVEPERGGIQVTLANGDIVQAANVVVALPAEQAADLLKQSKAMQKLAAQQMPIHTAIYDIGLSQLPNNKTTFVIGMDEPIYLQTHSRFADLAPRDGALIHTLYYRKPGETRSDADIKATLERVLDQAQPGWRDVVVTEQYLPHLMVSSGMPQAGQQFDGPSVPDLPGVYLAGDWVNQEILADGSLSTAKAAAQAILRQAMRQTA